jgi:hypothetical protein
MERPEQQATREKVSRVKGDRYGASRRPLLSYLVPEASDTQRFEAGTSQSSTHTLVWPLAFGRRLNVK